MNADANVDVIVYGPVGLPHQLKRKGTSPIVQPGWIDWEDSELENAIWWVINEQQPFDQFTVPKVHIYSGTMYTPPGQTWRVGKNIAGHGTMFHYIIVSDQKVESQEEAEALVWESLKGGDNGQVLES